MKHLLPIFALALFACGGNAAPTCEPACANGFVCTNGACVGEGPVDMAAGGDGMIANCMPACGGLTPYCNASHHCVSCTDDTQCAIGSYCKKTNDSIASCVPGCVDDTHCGNLKCCGGSCVDPTKDVRNCGGCAMPCAAPNADSTCNNSTCAVGNCHTGYGDCNNDSKDGCEANLHLDPTNCTACGMSCGLAHAISGCSDGCYIQACNFGFDDCNQNTDDGCETSTLSDPSNCGSCSNSCAGLPNAMANCVSGNCVLGMCNPGFFDCNGDPKDGCEANLQTDRLNCSKCGMACQNGLYCVNGTCQMGCLMGQGPPAACFMGVDPMDKKSKWVICQADCNSAWVSTIGGGKYYAGDICVSMGYSKVGMYGGTCGDVCSYCVANTSCMAPGANKWDNGGLQGNDMLGPILSSTVQWQCLK